MQNLKIRTNVCTKQHVQRRQRPRGKGQRAPPQATAAAASPGLLTPPAAPPRAPQPPAFPPLPPPRHHRLLPAPAPATSSAAGPSRRRPSRPSRRSKGRCTSCSGRKSGGSRGANLVSGFSDLAGGKFEAEYRAWRGAPPAAKTRHRTHYHAASALFKPIKRVSPGRWRSLRGVRQWGSRGRE